MRAKLQGKIVAVSKDEDGMTRLTLLFQGKVSSSTGPLYSEAKAAKMTAELILRPIVSNEMKLGSIITMELNDQEPETRIE